VSGAFAPARPEDPVLLVLDADSTTLKCEVIELLAAAAGAQEYVARVTERAMRGELDFAASLRERVSALAGLPVSVYEQVRAQVEPTDGAAELFAAVHAAGGRVGIVSGGFHEVLDPIAAVLGADFWRANRLETADGVLTGRLYGPIVDAAAKASALLDWSAETGIPLSRAVAIGDGANDLEMMARAGLSIAFNAKPLVRERADRIVEELDLRAVLPLLGLV